LNGLNAGCAREPRARRLRATYDRNIEEQPRLTYEVWCWSEVALPSGVMADSAIFEVDDVEDLERAVTAYRDGYNVAVWSGAMPQEAWTQVLALLGKAAIADGGEVFETDHRRAALLRPPPPAPPGEAAGVRNPQRPGPPSGRATADG